MEEKIIIKSERYNVKKIAIIFVTIGIALYVAFAYVYTSIRAQRYYELAAKNYDWFDYTSPLDYAFSRDWALYLVVLLVPIVFAIIAFIIYRAYSKIELTVTDKRVFGCATFGKRVDLPFDSISAVGTSSLKGIDVTSASGAIKFKYIVNHNEIHNAISSLLIERQNKSKTVATTIKQEIPQSNADELKKYKDLLDSGIITQEEFDAKKKQLLGL